MSYDTGNPQEKGGSLIKEANRAFSGTERTNAENTWGILAEYILPSQNAKFHGDVQKGTRKDQHLYDSTAILANRDLASAMHSTITNPTMEWSKLRFKTDALNDNNETAKWLSDATNTIHQYLNDSNFDAQIGRSYQSLSGFGSMILFQEELTDPVQGFQGFRFYAWHLAEISMAENSLGTIDRIYRKFTMTMSQAYEKFGDTMADEGESPLQLEDRVMCNKDKDEDFYHIICPRPMNEVEINSIGYAVPNKRPFASYYVMKKGAKIVKEDGYYEFPCFVGRWQSLPGEVYGRGPGHDGLPDIRTLNKVKEQVLRALAKTVNPPIFTTQQNMFTGAMNPGSVLTVRDPDKIKEFVTQSRFDVSQIQVQELVQSIRSAFYIDKLLLPPRTETGEMTAYEVSQRLEQMQQILGPVLSKLNAEFLTPFVMRCLKILNRNGALPPLPASLQQAGGELDFEVMFVNSLARSQQMSELQNVQSFVQEAAQLAQVNPAVLDNLNTDTILTYMAAVRTIPPEMLVPADQVAKIRDQRAQQQQAAQALQAGESIGTITKDTQQPR